MSNIIQFPHVSRSVAAVNSAQVIELKRRSRKHDAPKVNAARFDLTRERELASLEEALSMLADAKARADMAGVREWRDELEVMEMHTDRFDVRARCRAALRFSVH
ncbi:hypothetical protein [Oryzifoliimicrobium ureilyticus]|uniref:hypothetical protein n=1 Tax=Oryzifoliimicrobium ureilyticus TaxID=3113724 RepID=UPI0030764C5E